MRALRKDFWMEIRTSKARFISIFMIVALGVAFFSGIQASSPDMRLSGDAYYDEKKVNELMNNSRIIRNSRKIKAAIKNAQIFIEIQKEFGSFSNYLWSYTNHKIIYLEDEELATTSPLSDKISKDLKKRGMSFVGSITIYSYLEAIGIYNHHQRNCFLHP